MKNLILLSILVLFYLLSCAPVEQKNTPEKKQPPLNPNGDSELALLMRAMADEAFDMKEHIKNGTTPEFGLEYHKILTADATEPEKAASPEYKAFAQTYLQVMEAYQKANPEKQKELYSSMVDACMTCHKALCPGPTMRIKKLVVK